MARPTKYKEEYCEEVEKYIEDCEEKSKEGEVCLPTIEGIALLLDVNRKTLYNWKEEHEAFLHALEKVDYKQKKMLEDNGLAGDYNSTIAKLILSSNHGMKERKDVTSKEEKVSTELTEEQRQELLEEIKNEQ